MRATLIGAVSALALAAPATFAAESAQPAGWTSLDAFVGKSIVDARGAAVGEVEDIVLDREGKVHAVIDLEDSDKDIAVEAMRLRVSADDTDSLTVSGMTRQQMTALTGFSYDSDRADASVRAEQARDRAEDRASAATATAAGAAGERSDADTASAQEVRRGGGSGAAFGPATPTNANPPSSPQAQALEEMLENDVVDAEGRQIGEIEDIIMAGQSDQVRHVVIDLDDSDKDVAVDMSRLRRDADDRQIWVMQGADRDALQAMTPYQPEENAVSLRQRR